MPGRHAKRRFRIIGAVAMAMGAVALVGYVGSTSMAPQDVTDQVLAIPSLTTVESTSTETAFVTATKTAMATKTVIVTRTRYQPVSRDETRYGVPQTIARELLEARGWLDQWSCLNSLINRESGWNVHATNPSSGAYGIPQALPAGKMASAGADWRDNPRTQLVWMMGYIKSVYSTPCGAWAHSQKTGWY